MTDGELKAELERLRDEDNRQNHRIEILEQSVRAIQDLTTSVHVLAHDMAQMLQEQREQGKRLDTLEKEPANEWKGAKRTIITTVISTIAGGLATGLIFILSQTIR